MKMQNAEMEFVAFDAQDVIATSGGLTFTVAGLGDKIPGNATIVANGNEIYSGLNYKSNHVAELVAILQSEVDSNISEGTLFKSDSPYSQTLGTLFGVNGYSSHDSRYSANTSFNGIYKWISDNGYFQMQ